MLPPGAAPPAIPRSAELVKDLSPPSPPSTPRQWLLDPEDQHVQYASYPENISEVTLKNIVPAKTWTPLPLRPYIYLPYVLFLVLLAVALEVALHVSQKNSGFEAHGDADTLSRPSGVWHYIYTLPPVALAMFVVGMWAWTDIEIKKLQPYVDLVQGDSPPHRSLLLDYTRHHTLLVWWPALTNKHYTVFLASLLAILSLAFQPLAAALLNVRDIYWSLPVITTTPNTLLGLAPGLSSPPASAILDIDSPISDMTAFLSASGFAAAFALNSDLPNPPFVTTDPTSADRDGWTVMDVAFPKSLPRNSTTVTMNVTALRTSPNCRKVQVSMTQLADSTWNNTIADEATNCGLTWNVTRTGPNLFGANVTLCANDTIPAPTEDNAAGKRETNPVVFWFFTYAPSARASATLCRPTIQLFDVTATLSLVPNFDVDSDVQSSLVKVVTRNSFGARSPAYTQFASNLSALVDSTTNSIAAFNGLDWDRAFTPNAPAVHDRLQGARLVMPAAIWRKATGTVGVEGAFGSEIFVTLSDRVYASYLSLLAKSLYFVPYRQGQAQDESVDLLVKTTVKRLFLSPFSAHTLTALLLILALLSLFIHLSHTHARQNLRLRHLPGTIASAVSIGGQTGTSALLSEKEATSRGSGMTDTELKDALRERRFRIDPATMKIVMEGEEGYSSATSPNYRQGEFMWIPEAVERIKRGSRRMSGLYGGRRESRLIDMDGSPRSPRTPRTPRGAEPGRPPRSGEAQRTFNVIAL
ncbi:hypothetical protein AAF712_003733 [Marasmius tenuissimus]|uniref:Uncharacterized protein n=1 Tax=Marasmius tenuissimus TaxID=585030 RepID=A0ABR3A6C1_9AGAR